MSPVCTSSSSVTGRLMPGVGTAPSATRRAARSAPSRISRQDSVGCRFAAENRVIDSLVTTCSAPGAYFSVSAQVTASPETKAIGTPKCSATRALIPLSPTVSPLTRAAANTSGL
jgi:hypothetical protein